MSFQYAVSEEWKFIYGLLCFFSMISSLIIPIIYFISKRLRHHPAGILVLICIFEMICSYHLMIWAMDLPNFLYFFRVEQIWNAYLFAFQTNVENFQMTECLQNQYIYFLSLFFEFNYYIILCLDLIITLKQPLISGNSRMGWYHFGVIICSLIQFAFTKASIQKQCESTLSQSTNYTKPLLFISYVPVIISEIIFYILGITSIIFAIKNLHKTKKTSAIEIYQAKNEYASNHSYMVIIVIGVWLVPFINNIKMILRVKKEVDDADSYLLNYVSFSILLSQGIFLALIRLRERFFRLRLTAFILSLFGNQAYNQEVDQMEAEDQADQEQWNYSLATLLRKVQNQEVLNNILQGVISIIQLQNSIQSASIQQHVKQIHNWTKEKKSKVFHSSGEDSQESLLTAKQVSFDITVTEYAQRVFQGLRQLDDLDTDQLVNSLCIERNKAQIKQAQKSMGRSGSFFFFSHDNLLILKTITQKELTILLHTFLTQYVGHLISVSNDSLIARVYGAYTISIEGVSPIHLILMENTLDNVKKLTGMVQRRYDLKGSLTNRFVKVNIQESIKEKRKISGQVTDETLMSRKLTKNQAPPQPQVLKDVNFLESEDLFIQLPCDTKELLLDIIKKDTEFLKSIHIMDYSLLIGASTIQPNAKIDKMGWRGLKDLQGNLLSFAIIDYLQLFDIMKYLELKYKTLIKNKEEKFLSCIKYDQYQTRFNQFLNLIISPVIYH